MKVEAIRNFNSNNNQVNRNKNLSKNFATNSLNGKELMSANGNYGQAQVSMHNPSFGMDPITIGVILEGLKGIGIILATSYAITAAGILLIGTGIAIADKVDEHKRKKDLEKAEKIERAEVEKISETQNISISRAEKLYTNYIKTTEITPENNGYTIGLNRVMGYYPEKLQILSNVIAPVINKQKGIDESDLPINHNIPNGIILYGPSGSGKTYMADAIGEHLKYFGSDYKNIDVTVRTGNTPKKIVKNLTKAFSEAEKRYKKTGKYTVIVMDDFDNTFNNRYKNSAPELTEAFMKLTENCAQKGIIWIGTANNPRRIDPALLRKGRCDLNFKIDVLESYANADTIKYNLLKAGMNIDKAKKIDYQSIVDYMKNDQILLTPAELEFCVNNVTNRAGKRINYINSETILKEIIDFYATNEDFSTLNMEEFEKLKQDKEYLDGLQ